MPKGLYRIRDGTANGHRVYVRYIVGDDEIPEDRYRTSRYDPPFDALRWSDQPAQLRLEFICETGPMQFEPFSGSIDDAIVAARGKLKAYEATLARIVDAESRDVLKLVVRR